MGAIRASAFLRGFGFAPLNCADSLALNLLRLGQTACAYTFAILPTQKNKKTTRKKRGSFSRRAGFFVFGFVVWFGSRFFCAAVGGFGFGGRRLWVRAVVWWRLFLRLVRRVCFRRLPLRAAFPVSVRARGLRSLLLSGAVFLSSFFLAFLRAFPLLRFCPLRGRVRGFLPVPVFGGRAFASRLLRRLLYRSKPLHFLCLTRFLLDFFIHFYLANHKVLSYNK